MESLRNCHIIIEIESIEKISGGNQRFEVVYSTKEEQRHRLVFEHVWDLRYSIENGFIDRGSKFEHAEKVKSNVYLVENSDYVKYFEKQVSGTRPVSQLKDYIIFDAVDTVVEVLTTKEPQLLS